MSETAANATSGWKTVRLGSWRWQIAARHANEQTLRLLAAPEALLQPPSVHVPRNPPRRFTAVARLEFPQNTTPAWFIKRFNPGRFVRDFKDWFRPSRAVRAARVAAMLGHLNIPTAAVVAVGEKRCLRWLLDSYLITEEVPNACSWQDLETRNPDLMLRRHITLAVARLLAKLHDAGIAHYDPARPNFLVRLQSNGEVELALIDLDGVRPEGRVSDQVARKNLARTISGMRRSNLERLRFVVEYCASRSNPCPLSAREWAQALGLLKSN